MLRRGRHRGSPSQPRRRGSCPRRPPPSCPSCPSSSPNPPPRLCASAPGRRRLPPCSGLWRAPRPRRAAKPLDFVHTQREGEGGAANGVQLFKQQRMLRFFKQRVLPRRVACTALPKQAGPSPADQACRCAFCQVRRQQEWSTSFCRCLAEPELEKGGTPSASFQMRAAAWAF